jgi:hypothetical protein
LGENLKQKVAQNVAITLGYFIFSKNHNEPPKVAQLAKSRPIWSRWKRLALQKLYYKMSSPQRLN